MRIRSIVSFLATCACVLVCSACALLPRHTQAPIPQTPSSTVSSVWVPAAQSESPQDTPKTVALEPSSPASLGVSVYRNLEFGFELALPPDWRGPLAVESKGFGYGGKNASATVRGEDVWVDLATVKVHPPYSADDEDIQPVVIVIFTRADWDSIDDPSSIMAAPGGGNGVKVLGENSDYVFTLGSREYGFSYGTGIAEAKAIAETLRAFEL